MAWCLGGGEDAEGPDNPDENDELSASSREHGDLASSLREHSDLPSSSRQHIDLPSSSREHSDLPSSSRQHSDLPSSSREHSDLPSSSREHDVLPFSSRENFGFVSSLSGLGDHPHSSSGLGGAPYSLSGVGDLPFASSSLDDLPFLSSGFIEIAPSSSGHRHAEIVNLPRRIVDVNTPHLRFIDLDSTSRGFIDVDSTSRGFIDVDSPFSGLVNVASLSSEVDVSSSDEEENTVNASDIVERLTTSYNYTDRNDPNLSKFFYSLEQALQSGTLTCLICLSHIKRKDAVWSCTQCYTMFHLMCIQKWAHEETLRYALTPGQSVAPIQLFRPMKYEWNCPKCRLPYTDRQIPKDYKCYCGKEIDPPVQAWLAPHSCGNMCELPLKPPCGHKCVILCHPGACPPCPRSIKVSCHCGRSEPRDIRCFKRGWDCGEPCGRPLSCGNHKCALECHKGLCPPCKVKQGKRCVCKGKFRETLCGTPDWHCDQVCQRQLRCGYHVCGVACHAPGACPPCPLSGSARCPCRKELVTVECPGPVPTCGNTCDALLRCGLHTCPQLCHHGECDACMHEVEKTCPCGAKKKNMPCSKVYRCQTRCPKLVCPRHECGRKCCMGCGPCNKLCREKLNCNKHKCNRICHLPRPCSPCHLAEEVSCPCGEVKALVACGTKLARPPACRNPCKIRYPCSHNDKNKHGCHSGECPPCKFKCDELLPCGHKCSAICHQSVKVTKVRPTETAATPVTVTVKVTGLHCPPCTEMVEVLCLGQHETMSQPCLERRLTCGRECGRELPCGKHKCTLECHNVDETACEECTRACEGACAHGCALGRCHAGACPPCDKLVRVTCYCKLQTLLIECASLESTVPSCGTHCIKFMECGHRCRLTCHQGPCSPSSECVKPVKVPCACNTVKSECPCNEAKEHKTPCNEACEQKRTAAQKKAEEEADKKRKLEEEKNKKELEEYERLFRKAPKQRKNNDERIVQASAANMNIYVAAAMAAVVVIALGYCLMSMPRE